MSKEVRVKPRRLFLFDKIVRKPCDEPFLMPENQAREMSASGLVRIVSDDDSLPEKTSVEASTSSFAGSDADDKPLPYASGKQMHKHKRST